MSNDGFDGLSAVQRESVRSALIASFGSAAPRAITRITGGASGASTFKLKVGDRCFLLRIEGQPSPLRNPHQYVSLRIAAEAGIAPKIHYIDEKARIAVMDYIEQRPLQSYPGEQGALAQALGELLSRVQATPVFHYFVNYPDIVARLFAHVCRTGLFAAGVLDRCVEKLELLRQAYDSGSISLVSSHNDSIPSNILFDGERLWLIDWESAYCNDPLVDIAIALDNLARSRELEDVLLKAWLCRSPDEQLRARLEVVRALTRLYYAGVLLSASAATSGLRNEVDLSVPTVADFDEAIRTGRLQPGAAKTKHILGKMFLESFFSGGLPPGFHAAV